MRYECTVIYSTVCYERTVIYVTVRSSDLRVGIVLSIVSELQEKRVKVVLDLGPLGLRSAIGFFNESFDVKTLLDKQVLLLVNLDKIDLLHYFNAEESSSILCTVARDAFLEPTRLVEDGFKLA